MVLRYLPTLFCTRLVVLEYWIDKLGKNHVILQCDVLIFQWNKNHFWTKLTFKILTTPLESLYCEEFSNEYESNIISTIDIVVGGENKISKINKYTYLENYN